MASEQAQLGFVSELNTNLAALLLLLLFLCKDWFLRLFVEQTYLRCGSQRGDCNHRASCAEGTAHSVAIVARADQESLGS